MDPTRRATPGALPARVREIVPALALSLVACGGGGGSGSEPSGTAAQLSGCADIIQLVYRDSRIPAHLTSWSSSDILFPSLEPVRFDPVPSRFCAAARFRVASGSLPEGMTLDEASGAVFGTPRESGGQSVVIGLKVSGYRGEAMFRLEFTVDDFGLHYSSGTVVASLGVPLSLAPALTDGLLQGRPSSPGSNAERGSMLPAGATLDYVLVSGALPPGVVLDGRTGLVSGTPLAPGSYNAVVRVTATHDGASLRPQYDTIVDIVVPQ